MLLTVAAAATAPSTAFAVFALLPGRLLLRLCSLGLCLRRRDLLGRSMFGGGSCERRSRGTVRLIVLRALAPLLLAFATTLLSARASLFASAGGLAFPP